MTFDEIVDQAIEILQRRGRVTYRTLKRQFQLDDEALADLTMELVKGQRLAVDEDGEVLVWTGGPETPSDSTPVSAPPQPPLTSLPTTALERDPLSYTPQHLADKILTSRSAMEGERKQVTVLFCDLANSTALAERIGPEAMHTLLNRFFELALEDVHRYEGTINQFLGDGFMALFGAPIAHEDHARRGVLAALALQRRLADHHHALGAPFGVTCRFRMGLNSGLVVVGSIGDNLRMDYSAVGDTTNLTSRLQQLAEPGTMLISASTARLVQGFIRLSPLPPVEVKGKSVPITPSQVIGTLPRRSPLAGRDARTFSPFVGRQREIDTLEGVFAQVETGQGQVVGVVAEAGGGKSRLLYEFRQRVAAKQVTYLEGRCVSYGHNIPYHPIIDILRHNCDLTDSDSPTTIRDKVAAALQEVGMPAETSTPYLLHLLGVREGTEALAVLTPEAIRTRIFETLKQMSLKGSEQRPLIFEIEDLHWSDQTSEAYLATLVESLPGAPILLLTTYRPGYRPPWLDKSYATQISLSSLTPQDGTTVVQSTHHRSALPAHVVQLILERAEGNPFFLEELTRAVIEHGELQADTPVPDTVQGVLMARIDRLPEAPKRALQTASVLGREFTPRLLEAIWDDPAALAPLLQQLQHLEFLYTRTGAEEPAYVFKHALTQDVAYESLLTTRRQHLHTAAAQALERLYADRLPDAYDRLAYHYARTMEAEKAVTYLRLTAAKAAASYAHAEAVTTLEEALRHAEQLAPENRDRQTLDLTLHLAHSLYFLGRSADALEHLLRHQDRLERLHDPAVTGVFYFWLGHTYTYLGQQAQAASSAQRALESARSCNDQITMGKAAYVLARTRLWLCHFEEGVAYGHQAVAILERTAEQWWLGQSHWIIAWNYAQMGKFVRALEAASQAHTIGTTIQDPRLPCYAAWTRGWIYALQGDWELGIEACQQSFERSPDPLNTSVSRGFLGYVYMEHGDTVEAISCLQHAAERMQQFHFPQLQSWFTAWWAEACLLGGEVMQAQDLAGQAFDLSRDIENWWGVGIAQRALGRIALQREEVTQAARHLHEALETFEAIHARYDVARIHLDLATLASTQEEPVSTTMHLSTAHAWFTKLQVPRWSEKTEQRAREYGVTLTEVALEDLPEREP